jgi:hypothetical protein
MLTSPSPTIRSLARFALTLRMVKTIRRTEWLYPTRGRVPPARIGRRAPKAVGDMDIELCQRLIAAYVRAGDHAPPDGPTVSMWSWIFRTRQRELAATLDNGNVKALAALMASMFRQNFMLGMASGPLLSDAHSRIALRIWCLRSLDWLVSLADALGVVPVENPEQGGSGLAFASGVGPLIVGLEQELGFNLDFPDVGAPCGLEVEGRVITPDTPDQIYAAVRLDQAISLHWERGTPDPHIPHVVEIGGGYGGMCYWFLRQREDAARYTIVDLPIVNVLQGYFLAHALGSQNVSFYGEPPSRVEILPNFALAEVDTPFEVLVNKDSMPEMPREAMMAYIDWGGANCEGLFYSYNQEASAEFLGEVQGIVHKAITETGHFERLRRDEAWVRRGYVEEIYVPTGMPTDHEASPRDLRVG